jgi:hypothetical protein
MISTLAGQQDVGTMRTEDVEGERAKLGAQAIANRVGNPAGDAFTASQ